MEHSKEIVPHSVPGGLSHRGFATREEALYICPLCGPIEPHHAKLIGRYLRQPCPCQIAERQRRQAAELKLAHLRDLARITYDWLGEGRDDVPLVERTFETFKPIWWALDRETHALVEVNMQAAYDTARAFCLDMEGRTLILYGPCGTGKTHLLAAICNELRLQNKLSRFAMAPNLHKAIQECYRLDTDPGPIFRNAIKTPLLVIDDVGASKWTDTRQETYEMIIEARTKHGLPIALSTNHLDKLVEFVGERACSRLSIGQIAVEMTGKDYRMEM